MMDSKVLTYCCPTQIHLGIHAHRTLPEIITRLGANRLLFLTDNGVASTEIFKLVKDLLEQQHLSFDLFTDIEPDPSHRTVEEAYRIYERNKASVLLTLGGGSTIDVGKAVGILAANGGRIQDYEGIDQFRNPPVPILAIPTTAGTGSEVSGSCVITDTDRGLKLSIRGSTLNRAKVAILDPVALRSLPAAVAIYPAIDAFVHALESYVSLNANPVTDAMNLYAIELISQNVRPFVANRNNLEAGLQMLCAASLAGMGFSNTGAGNIHCMARFVGAFFHVPHGLANAVCLPHGADFNLMASPRKFARLAAAMGEPVHGMTTLEAARTAIGAIRRLNGDLGIPSRLREIGVTENRLPEMARLCFEANYNRWNPRYTTVEDFQSLFEKAF